MLKAEKGLQNRRGKRIQHPPPPSHDAAFSLLGGEPPTTTAPHCPPCRPSNSLEEAEPASPPPPRSAPSPNRGRARRCCGEGPPFQRGAFNPRPPPALPASRPASHPLQAAFPSRGQPGRLGRPEEPGRALSVRVSRAGRASLGLPKGPAWSPEGHYSPTSGPHGRPPPDAALGRRRSQACRARLVSEKKETERPASRSGALPIGRSGLPRRSHRPAELSVIPPGSSLPPSSG